MSYKCRNCGASSEDADSLCSAASDNPEAPFCGIPKEWVCEDKFKEMEFSCVKCGSISAESKHLCEPGKLKIAPD